MSDAEIVVGRVTRAHGLRGDLVIQPLADPDVLLQAEDVLLEQQGRRRPAVVRSARWQAKIILLAFEGFPDRTAAEALIGSNILMRRDQFPEADEDEHYISDLIGRPVVSPAGASLGQLVDVEIAGALTWLVVETKSGRKLVPFTEPLVKVDASAIVVDAPPGLLDDAAED